MHEIIQIAAVACEWPLSPEPVVLAEFEAILDFDLELADPRVQELERLRRVKCARSVKSGVESGMPPQNVRDR